MIMWHLVSSERRSYRTRHSYQETLELMLSRDTGFVRYMLLRVGITPVEPATIKE